MKRLQKWLLGAGAVLPVCLGGCFATTCVDNCASIPPGAIPAPIGTYNCKLQDTQAGKAEADDFVIYKYEWFMGGAELGPFGRYHINEIVNRLAYVPFPVIIQPHVDPQLTESRRQVIVNYLAQSGIPDPEQRVVVGFPAAEGLYGEEAEPTFERMIGGGRGGDSGRGRGGRFDQFSPFGAGFTPFGGFRGGFRGGLGGTLGGFQGY
jgi:hypothetical protein